MLVSRPLLILKRWTERVAFTVRDLHYLFLALHSLGCHCHESHCDQFELQKACFLWACSVLYWQLVRSSEFCFKASTLVCPWSRYGLVKALQRISHSTRLTCKVAPDCAWLCIERVGGPYELPSRCYNPIAFPNLQSLEENSLAFLIISIFFMLLRLAKLYRVLTDYLCSKSGSVDIYFAFAGVLINVSGPLISVGRIASHALEGDSSRSDHHIVSIHFPDKCSYAHEADKTGIGRILYSLVYHCNYWARRDVRDQVLEERFGAEILVVLLC